MKTAIGSIFAAITVLVSTVTVAQESNPVSNFGTSFTFNQNPICEGCLETELGYSYVNERNNVPVVVSFAPSGLKSSDFTLLYSVLEATTDDTAADAYQPGGNLAAIWRQRLLNTHHFVLTVAPQAVFYLRGYDGARLGSNLG